MTTVGEHHRNITTIFTIVFIISMDNGLAMLISIKGQEKFKEDSLPTWDKYPQEAFTNITIIYLILGIIGQGVTMGMLTVPLWGLCKMGIFQLKMMMAITLTVLNFMDRVTTIDHRRIEEARLLAARASGGGYPQALQSPTTLRTRTSSAPRTSRCSRSLHDPVVLMLLIAMMMKVVASADLLRRGPRW